MTEQSKLQALLTQADTICAAATPGPWTATNDGGLSDWRVRDSSGENVAQLRLGSLKGRSHHAAFIAFSRTALPALVKEVKRLRRSLKDAEDVLVEEGIVDDSERQLDD